MNMGDRIKFAREQAGLSKAEFARRVGVSKGLPTQWEASDIKDLRMENLFAVEDATGFRARWIALGTGPKRVSDSAGEAPSPDDFDKFIKSLPGDRLALILHAVADKLIDKK